MNKTAKQLAYKTLQKYKLRNSRNFNDITNIIEKQGFIVIPFKKCNNAEDVSACVEKLHLEEIIKNKDSFIYLSNNLKLVFINSDLSDEDKYILLCHELGHILDPSLQNSNFTRFKIQNEEFANEFSYHLQNPSLLIRLKSSKFFKPVLISLFSICLLIVCSIWLINVSKNFFVVNSTNITETYYVTSSGKRYHRDFCIIVKNRTSITEYKTLEDVKSNGYTPCLLCIGEE